jgi:thioredoxin 1
MSDESQTLDVFCLCAEWCGVCRTLRPELEALRLEGFRIYWIDIEEHADALDAIEIDTFPTVIVANGSGTICFAGVMEPHIVHFEKLLRSLAKQGLSPSSTSTEITALISPCADGETPWSLALKQLKRSGALRPL